MDDETPAVDETPYASIDELLGKPPAVEEHTILLPGPGGSSKAVRLRLRALPASAYDALVTEYQIEDDDKKKPGGTALDMNRFIPGLIAACLEKPQLTVEQATQMINGGTWSPGEVGDLFAKAQALCLGGFDVPKSGNG